MKSSSIALLHLPAGSSGGGGSTAAGEDCTLADRAARGVLVNLIDSPGHVDFCSEVRVLTAHRCAHGPISQRGWAHRTSPGRGMGARQACFGWEPEIGWQGPALLPVQCTPLEHACRTKPQNELSAMGQGG